jgi:hypothetical protein
MVMGCVRLTEPSCRIVLQSILPACQTLMVMGCVRMTEPAYVFVCGRSDNMHGWPYVGLFCVCAYINKRKTTG